MPRPGTIKLPVTLVKLLCWVTLFNPNVTWRRCGFFEPWCQNIPAGLCWARFFVPYREELDPPAVTILSRNAMVDILVSFMYWIVVAHYSLRLSIFAWRDDVIYWFVSRLDSRAS